MSEKQERLQILEMIESGVISAGEGARLLRALEEDGELEDLEPGVGGGNTAFAETQAASDEVPEVEGSTVPSGAEFGQEIEKWKRWWMIPLWIGLAITMIGSLLMLWAYQTSGFGFWFGFAWLPFLLGVGVIALAWGSRTARWLHLRVQQRPGKRPHTVAFSFPLPLRFTSWFMRVFSRFIPDLRERGIDVGAMIQAIENTTGPDTPFYIEVNEGEGNEKVQIFIG